MKRDARDEHRMEAVQMADIQAYDPFDELKRIQDRIASIFGGQSPMTGTNMNTPSVDIQQHGNEIIVTADMPGVDKNDIRINVRDDRTLEISAQKKMEKTEEEKTGFLRKERRYMGYYRSMMLPAAVDKTKAKASYNNGVLTVTLPMMQKQEEKKSEIQVT
jgi:HSP20 family protein